MIDKWKLKLIEELTRKIPNWKWIQQEVNDEVAKLKSSDNGKIRKKVKK